LQDGQRVASLIGQRDGAPLLHAGAGYGFAVAVLGVIGVDGTDAAYVGVEDVVGNAAHHLEDVAAMDVVLVVAGGAGDLKIVAFAAVPFSIYAVQRQADLSVDVGPQGLLRPGGTNQTHKITEQLNGAVQRILSAGVVLLAWRRLMRRSLF